jgi:hypothetical protein
MEPSPHGVDGVGPRQLTLKSRDKRKNGLFLGLICLFLALKRRIKACAGGIHALKFLFSG